MKKPRPPKKSESLEVRVPHGVKRAFMERARSRGRTASGVLRDFIEAYLAGASPEDRTMLKRLATPAAATAVIGAVIAAHGLMPTAASANPDFKSVFDKLDSNADGMLSEEELAGNAPMAGAAYLEHKSDLGHGAVPLMVAVHSSFHARAHGAASPEAKAGMRKTFAKLDGDASGTITFGEFESHHLAVIRHAFDSIDADQNGKIARAELETAMQHIPDEAAPDTVPFERLDGNSDGAIDWKEFLG